MFELLADPALAFLRRYGYLALFAFAFLETSMLFPFLPSEVVVPAAAALLVSGAVGVVTFAAVAAAGTVAGSLVAYAAGRRGYDVLDSRAVFVSEDDLTRGRNWFRRWGEGSVLWGRFLPFLRSVISLPAGFAEMGRAKFAAYSGAGGFAFNAAVAGVVFYGKRRSVYAAAADWAGAALGTTSPAVLVGVVVLALAVAGAGWWAWEERA